MTTKASYQRARKKAEQYFHDRNWKPFIFQQEAWKSYAEGKSGLVHAPTGTGKTYAVWTPTLLEWISEQKGKEIPKRPPQLRVLWLTPLRALVEDTTRTLEELSEGMGLPWNIQSRTGDTSGSVKAKQRKKYPSCLVTTPESLSLLLSYPETKEALSDLRAVIVDGGTNYFQASGHRQAVLSCERNPALKTWGLSATLGNLDTALSTLVGSQQNGPINGI